MPLEDKDHAHLVIAEGYIALGKYLDADAELDEIDPEVRHVPEVRKLRRICGPVWDSLGK